MRITDILHSVVVDAAGESLGRVSDVRLVQDGPLLSNFGAALRVDGLFVGRSALGLRLGFDRQHVTGPKPLKTFFSRLERRGHYVRWNQVGSVEDRVVRLRVPVSELQSLGEPTAS